ncbi:hypothetical protein E2C01_030596 [Portunus trituberculatus]|uniref:Uncharacterized protein n=1 Tax=Portunus trituberculatus TaxID=210409 RepID=A0A5B7ESF3_PORTR|nr:hypothetical protein [Portunus trituberculatus]
MKTSRGTEGIKAAETISSFTPCQLLRIISENIYLSHPPTHLPTYPASQPASHPASHPASQPASQTQGK